MPDDGYVSIATLKGGAAIEAVDHALGEVWDNIVDPNTAPEAKRSVTLTLIFKPQKDREGAACSIEVKAKLAPQAPMAAQIIVDKENGKAVAAEFGRRNPGQAALEGVYDDAKVTPIRKVEAQ